MVGIIDYGVGNLFSLKSSLAYIGEEAVVTNDPAILQKCDHIILPGVGAFGDAADKLKVPHIGWNGLHFPKEKEKSPIFADLAENDCVYFVHSFAAVDCTDYVTATAEYGAELTAAVARGNVYGCQFHPEKSGEVGLKILKAFCNL